MTAVAQKPERLTPDQVEDDLKIVPEIVRAPSYNYWAIGDDHPMKRAMVERYNIASTFVRGVVVDAACGWGLGSAILGFKARRVFGFDLWARAIAFAQKRSRHPTARIYYDVADLEGGDFEVPDCDWAVSFETLEHLRDPLRFVRQMQEKTREGIVVSVPPHSRKSAQNNPFHEQDIPWGTVENWFNGWGENVHRRIVKTEMPNGRMRDISIVGVWRKT